jgi:hypothetical protein
LDDVRREDYERELRQRTPARMPRPSGMKLMANIDERAVSDALLTIVRRIEAMPGDWHRLTNDFDKALRSVLTGKGNALDIFLALRSGQVEFRTVKVRSTPYSVVRAVRGSEQDDDPHVVVVWHERPIVAVLDRRPQDASA